MINDVLSIDSNLQNLEYHKVILNDDGERVGPCPRGATWNCSECYLMTLYDSGRIEESELGYVWTCTPYLVRGDLAIANFPDEDGNLQLGYFLQDYLIEELGEYRSLGEDDIEVCQQIAFDYILQAGRKSELN